MPPSRLRRGALAALAAVLTVMALHLWGTAELAGNLLDLQSITVVSPRHALFLVHFALLGAVAAGCVAVAVAQVPERLVRWVTGLFAPSTDTRWLLYGTAAGLLLPAVTRIILLHGVPLTDDEAAYRFMAQLLSTGRLWAESPPHKLFFDSPFMVNDGRRFSQYFVGWPALLAPWIWLRLEGFANSFYAAATVVPVFLLARQLAGSVWAKVAVLLLLLSPMWLILSATMLSHTCCAACLAWLAWLALAGPVRTGADGGALGGLLRGAAVATVFSLAFAIRPLTGLGIGAPFLVVWLLRTRAGERRTPRLVGFFLAATLGAGLFLGANHLQFGSPFGTGYAAVAEYAKSNEYRWVSNRPLDEEAASGIAGARELKLGSPAKLVSRPITGLARLNFALFGWPCSFLFLAFALGAPGTRAIWGSLGLFLLVNMLSPDAGIETFGPPHYSELVVVVLPLTAVGLARLRAWQEQHPRVFGFALGPAVLVGLVAVNISMYSPVRIRNVARLADNLFSPYQLLAEAGVHDAVVFNGRPFASNCATLPTRHFARFRPSSDPDFTDDIIWANHITLEQDHELMQDFPDRTGWVLWWTEDCKLHLVPLKQLPPGSVPPGHMDW